MKTKLLAIAALLVASAAAGNLDTASAFSRLKSLAGEWEATTDMGKARISYTVIAGGTAVVEREFSDHMPEMLTVYYMDGQRLLLTHYCMVGNQPRMEAHAFDPATGELRFRFVDATNLADSAAGHMHNAALRFVDDRHFESAWEFFENGKPKMSEKAVYTRVR